MRRLTLIIICLVSLSSCGLFKKVFRGKQIQNTETRSEVKSDSSAIVVDRSTIVLREKIDTVITTKANEVTQQVLFSVDSLIKGMVAIKNSLLDVALKYDPATNLLTTNAMVKPQKIPVEVDRTITTNNDITTKTSVNKASGQESKTKTKNLEERTEPAKMGIWLVAIFLVIAVLSVLYWLKRKKR